MNGRPGPADGAAHGGGVPDGKPAGLPRQAEPAGAAPGAPPAGEPVGEVRAAPGEAVRGASAGEVRGPSGGAVRGEPAGVPLPAGAERETGGGRVCRVRAAPVLICVHACAGLLALVCLGDTLRTGLDDRPIALAFGALVAIGELTRWSGPQLREPAPLGAAGALSYALLGQCAGLPTGHGPAQVVTVVCAAALLGGVPHIACGRGPTPDDLARRTLTAGFAAACFQPLYNRGDFDSFTGPAYALLLVAVLALTALCDAVLAAALAHARTRWPFAPLLRDQLRALPGIGSAVCATGAVMALGVAVAGLWALPVFCLPLLLTQLAFRRYAAVRATYRQTIASLARATEIAGYTPAGHALRVAALSQAVGRDLGLSEPELTVLEYAALMHDIGQLSLLDPVPAGATACLPPEEQRRIALLGGAVVRQTGVSRQVARVVERQADPCGEQPLAARIVRAVNAYEEKARDAGPGGALAALEELRLGTAGDYAPEVVESLARVLSRERSDRPPSWVTHG